MVLQHRGSDFGALGIKKHRAVGFLLSTNLAEAVKHTLVGFVVSVREVKARDGHTLVDQFAHGLFVPALGPHGAHDLGFPSHRLILHDHRG